MIRLACVFLLAFMAFLLAWTIPAFAQEVYSDGSGLVLWLNEHTWFQYVMTAILGLKAITTVLPSHIKGQTWYNVAMKVVNYFILNFGKNKNADDRPINS